MRSFTDTAGTAWSFQLSTPDFRRVKQTLPGVDLLDLNGEVFTRLLQDPETLVDVLAVLLTDQLRRCKPTVSEVALRLQERAFDEGRELTPAETAEESRGGLSPVEFARRLGGDVLDSASNALLEAIIDFFPNRRRRTLRAALAKTNELLEKTAAHGLELIRSDRMDQVITNALTEMDRAFEAMARTPGGSSMSSPESSASTPTP